jgi:DNA-binding NarL/FixJ family response regulator
MRTSIVIVDDHSLFREGLLALLADEAAIEVLGSAGDGVQGLRLLEVNDPDVALVDLQMPILDGIEFAREVRRRGLRVRLLALTTFDDEERIHRFLLAGGDGFLLKGLRTEELVDSISRAGRGDAVLEPQLVRKVFDLVVRGGAPSLPSLASLSSREVEIFELIGRGASNKEISTSLSIAEGTVKNHITSLLRKLGVTDRTQAALLAATHGRHRT